MLLHHLGSLLSVTTALVTGDCHMHTLWMLATEFTTPLINNRWWLDKMVSCRIEQSSAGTMPQPGRDQLTGLSRSWLMNVIIDDALQEMKTSKMYVYNGLAILVR